MKCRHTRCVIAIAMVVGLAVVLGRTGTIVAQGVGGGLLPAERSRYSSLDAGADAYRDNEARRLGEVNHQIGLNNRLRVTSWYGSFLPGTFEPWPMIPGDIWGYPILSPIRQSVGQRSYQAGPNRWISEPVYAEDLAPPMSAAAPVVIHKTPTATAPNGTVIPRNPSVAPPAPGPNPRIGPGAAGRQEPAPQKPRGPVELPHPRPEPGDQPTPGPREF